MNDLNALQQLTDHTTSNVTSQLMGWLVVPSLILTLVIVALYITALVRRRRVESAIFEIRDLLKDMKANGQQPPAAAPPAPDNTALGGQSKPMGPT
jgi:hypothetical protein